MPDEAADILVQNLPDSIAFEHPYEPLGRNIYVYDDGGNEGHKNGVPPGILGKTVGKMYSTHCGKTIERPIFK